MIATTQKRSIVTVDHLPCELPRDASLSFGGDLLEHVIPLFNGDAEGLLQTKLLC